MHIILGPDLTYFGYSLGLGVIMAAIYDIIRIKRRLIFTSDFLVNTEDFLFILLCALSVIYLAYTKNNGFLRIYGILSSSAAFFAYRLVIGNRAVRFLACILKSIKDFVIKVIKVIVSPFKKVTVKICARGKRTFARLYNHIKNTIFKENPLSKQKKDNK